MEDSSLFIISIYLVCLIYACEWDDDFYRKNVFPLYDLCGHALAQKPLPRGWWLPPLGGGGHEISCLLTLQMPHTKFGWDWPISSWEEDVDARRTTDDDGRQPIAIGYLSYSGDLKTMVLYRKLWNFDLLWKKTIILWGKMCNYSKL